MPAIDHIDQRGDPAARIILQPHRSHHLAIDAGDLLALAQIGHGRGAVLLGHPERDAAAGAAAVQSRAPARAAPACHDARRNRRRARGARRSAGPAPVPRSRSPAATSASHSRTPRDRRVPIRDLAGGANCGEGNRSKADAAREVRCPMCHVRNRRSIVGADSKAGDSIIETRSPSPSLRGGGADEAIQESRCVALDCFASLAKTGKASTCSVRHPAVDQPLVQALK